ncbi:hypothetical protein [Brevundimonas sp. NPDC046655]|uniref:hypothetical protein n=1 Tax=unclassified Brevundimonas TaxID=2622653 RepID=UPI00384B6DF5
MSDAPASQNPWAHFFGLMGKIILLSWPIGALLLALNPIFVAVQNVLTSKDLWLGVFPSLVVAAKLWGFCVGVLMASSGITFWRGINKAGHRSNVG